jgi:transcriptional regulator of acetoin/glycerol metabolism
MGLEEYHVTASRHEASRYELMDSGYNLSPPYGRVASGQETGLFHVDRPGVAWDWMSQTGQAPNRSDWVRPQVAESWSRCIGDYGLTPGARLANGGTALDPDHPRASGILAQPDARATLANIAFSLHSLLRDTSVALLMADPAGTLIHVMEAGLVLGPAGRRLVALGSRWQEPVLGNNGLGTAAVLRKPVAFDGKEHFAAELHPYATVGQLITGPQGEPVALLGLITDRHDSASSLLCFLRLAEHLVESNLFEQLGSGGYTLRLRPTGLGAGVAVEDCLLDGLISVCETGIISGATRAALALLGCAEHQDSLGEPLENVLGLPLARVLSEPALDSTGVEVATPGGRVLTVQLIGGRRPSGLVPAAARASTSGGGRNAALRGQMQSATPGNGQWRDTVLEAALQKAIGAQKQKIGILITGESGVGKDHLVRKMHDAGTRQGRPLVLINCAAIPRDLISTELFGYEPGSFTGARTKGKPGKFLDAHTGTLFLDEIGDMALDLQAALLCALDTSEIVPVGGAKPIVVDVQVVAATNSLLQECVRKGTFRRDLYYRLNGAQINLPPLRERPDKLGLIMHLWEAETRAQGRASDEVFISDEVLEIFEQHPWPGNIRELRNVLRSCMATMSRQELRVSDLPCDFLEEMSDGACAEPVEAPELPSAAIPGTGALSAMESQTIRWALEATQGNISKSAKQLGITRATLYHKMARYGLRKPELRQS